MTANGCLYSDHPYFSSDFPLKIKFKYENIDFSVKTLKIQIFTIFSISEFPMFSWVILFSVYLYFYLYNYFSSPFWTKSSKYFSSSVNLFPIIWTVSNMLSWLLIMLVFPMNEMLLSTILPDWLTKLRSFWVKLS